MRNYHGYKNISEPPTDFMKTLLHKKAELSRMSSLKACRLCLKGKELVVGKVTESSHSIKLGERT